MCLVNVKKIPSKHYIDNIFQRSFSGLKVFLKHDKYTIILFKNVLRIPIAYRSFYIPFFLAGYSRG